MSKNAKHSVTINGHRTSVTLENDFWISLQEIAAKRKLAVNTLISEIDTNNPDNLSSALRIYVLNYYKNRTDVESL